MRILSKMPLITGILTSIALAPAIAASADDSPVTLKYTAKSGDSQHQQVVIKVDSVGAVLKQTQKRLIKDVSDTGDVTVLVTDEGGTLTVAGSDMPQAAGPDVTVKRDKLGKLSDWKPAKEFDNPPMAPEVMRATEQLYTVILPSAAVKEKDTWKVELDNPIFAKMKIKVENTYLGIDKVDGVDLWKIKQTATAPTDGDGGVVTFEGTFWLNPANGQMMKLEGTAKDVPTQFGKLSMAITVSPVKDDKPAPVAARTKKLKSNINSPRIAAATKLDYMNMRNWVPALAATGISVMMPFARREPSPRDSAAETEMVRSQQAPVNGVWLETLNLKNMRQDYGEPHRGKSIDDNPLTLGGVVYPHGVGSHAKSEIAIDLKGGSKRFLAMAGLDDERKSSDGSVTFQVWVDAQEGRRNRCYAWGATAQD